MSGATGTGTNPKRPNYETYLEDIRKIIKEQVVKRLFIIICVIIALVFVHQIFTLTNFIKNYKYHCDYGNMLRGVCNGAYTEYETGRFQVLDNISDIRINLEAYHYIALIFTIGMCVLFMLLVWGYYIILVTGKTPFEIAKDIGQYIKEFSLYQRYTQIYEESEIKENNWWIIQLIMLIISLYLPLVVIVYLSLRFTGGEDISPFKQPVTDNNASDKNEVTNNYISHFTLMGLIIIIFFVYALSYQFIWNHNANIWIILATAMTLLILFILSAYIMTLVCDIYVRKSTSAFYKNFEKFEKDPTYTDTEKDKDQDILGTYIKECLGFKEPKDVEKPGKRWNKIYGDVTTVLLLIFSILLGLFLICYVIGKCNTNKENIWSSLSSYIYYLAFLPFVVLYIILVLVTINVDYNVKINIYILHKPLTLYRQLIEKINEIFNKMLENDKTNVSNNSVCQNYANAIHLAIYQDIFRDEGQSLAALPNIELNHPNNVHTNESDVRKLLFVPRFNYNSICDLSEYVEYNKLEEYNIDAYINEGNNIFFDKSNQCDSIKNILLVVIMKNFVPIGASDAKAHDLFDKNVKENMIKYAINQIKSGKRFDGKKTLEYSDNYENNNRLNNEFNKDVKGTLDASDKHLEKVVKQVVDIYDKYLNTMLFETRQTVRTICACADTDDITKTSNLRGKIAETIMSYNSPYITNLKKNYVNIFVKHTKEMFNSINNVLTSTIEINDNNRRLAYFVMKNYNMIHTGDKVYNIEELPNKTKVSDREDPVGDAYLHIEKAKIEGDKIDGDIITDDLKPIQDKLRTLLIKFEKEYKALYNQDNNYYNQLIYEYKTEYIKNLITSVNKEGMIGAKEPYEVKYFKLAEFAKKLDNKDSVEKRHTNLTKAESEKVCSLANETSKTVYAMLLLYVLLIIFSLMVIR